ncbi:MAG: hypothetical protein Q3M30_13105 [Candidatus Electrothrix sp. Rat3]|nr:hypothetical protein [Candidatus Electrothrix rattekaaiensis]
MSRARARAIEYARVQSEIKKNYAEAERMEAEEKYFKRSWIRIIMKYSIVGIITAPVIIHLCLDTFKILYDINSYKIEENERKIEENKKIQKRISYENDLLKDEKENLLKDRIEFEKQNDLLKNERLELEKHYLEKLMRLASANAYSAYVYLVKKEEIYSAGKYASDEKKQMAHSRACHLLHDYWQIVVEIDSETQEDLFPEVKEKVASWLKEGEEKDLCPEECRTENGQLFFSPIRRNSLDLIEGHVAQVRAGNSQFPADLIDTFIAQLESQASDSGENKN